jgi:hypothetical protein
MPPCSPAKLPTGSQGARPWASAELGAANIMYVPPATGRSHKQKVCVDADFIIERLVVNGKEYAYKQVSQSAIILFCLCYGVHG